MTFILMTFDLLTFDVIAFHIMSFYLKVLTILDQMTINLLTLYRIVMSNDKRLQNLE